MGTDIDIAGLVRDGILDLAEVFCPDDWGRDADAIASYADRCGGPDGISPVQVKVFLEVATAYGITAYRYCATDDDWAASWCGPAMLDSGAAIAAGEEYASEHDDPETEEETMAREAAAEEEEEEERRRDDEYRDRQAADEARQLDSSDHEKGST